jgi:hypothetical protein
MEYHCSKDANVAKRIYENGLTYFADEIEYVDRYLGFLISINDESSESMRHYLVSSKLSGYQMLGPCSNARFLPSQAQKE